MRTDIPGVRVALVGKPEIVVFSIVDRIPAEQLSRAEEIFRGLIQQGHRRFVLDLSAADIISSNGVGLAVYYHKVLRELDGQMVVVKGKPALMERIGAFIEPVIRTVGTREEAIALLGGAGPKAVTA